MATKVEEVVVDAHLFDAQQLLPHLGDGLFQFGAGCHIGRRQRGPSVTGRRGLGRRVALRQGLAIALDATVQVGGGHHHLWRSPQRQHAVEDLHALLRRQRQRRHRAAARARQRRPEVPGIPIDADPCRAPGAAPLLYQRVHELVGRGIGRQTQPTEHGGDRRHHHHQFQRRTVERRLQRAQAELLGSQLGFAFGPRQPGYRSQRRAAQQASCVQHAMHRPKTLAGLRCQLAQRDLVGHVGAGQQQLGAIGLHRPQRGYTAAGRVLRGVASQPGIPGFGRRESATAHQHQPGLHAARQMRRQRQAHAAQPTGDDVDAALTQRHGGSGHRRAGRLEARAPAPPAAQRHHRLGPGIRQFTQQHRQANRRPVNIHVDVDDAAHRPRPLLWHHTGQAQHGGCLRAQRFVAGDRMQPVAKHLQPRHRVAEARGQRLHQVERAVERQVQRAATGGAGIAQAERMHHPARHRAGGLQRIQHLAITVGLGRLQRIVAWARLAQPVGRRHLHHRRAARSQFGHQRGARATAMVQHQPGSTPRLTRRRHRQRLAGEPGRLVTPLVGVGSLVQRARQRCRRTDRRSHRQPVTLAFERVARQLHATRRRARQRSGIDSHAGQPQPAQRMQQHLCVVALFARVPGARHYHRGLAGRCAGLGKGAQRIARSDLDKYRTPGVQPFQRSGELYRSHDVAAPGLRVGGVGIGDPVTAEVGQVGDAW